MEESYQKPRNRLRSSENTAKFSVSRRETHISRFGIYIPRRETDISRRETENYLYVNAFG